MMFDTVRNGQYNIQRRHILVLSPFRKCFPPPEIRMLLLRDLVLYSQFQALSNIAYMFAIVVGGNSNLFLPNVNKYKRQ